MSLRPTEGHLRPESPRAVDWQRVFGGLTVPLLSPVPTLADSPAGLRHFYSVDVARLAPAARARAVEHIAERFGVARANVEVGLDDPEQGLPILADDIGLTFDACLIVDLDDVDDEGAEDDENRDFDDEF